MLSLHEVTHPLYAVHFLVESSIDCGFLLILSAFAFEHIRSHLSVFFSWFFTAVICRFPITDGAFKISLVIPKALEEDTDQGKMRESGFRKRNFPMLDWSFIIMTELLILQGVYQTM